jgi:hypothetical protein
MFARLGDRRVAEASVPNLRSLPLPLLFALQQSRVDT